MRKISTKHKAIANAGILAGVLGVSAVLLNWQTEIYLLVGAVGAWIFIEILWFAIHAIGKIIKE